MSPTTGVRDVVASYSEQLQVEVPAIELLRTLGWEYANLYTESFGEKGTEGRASEHQVVLIRRLRAMLEKLNPPRPCDAYGQAIEQHTRDRSKQLAVNANQEVYDLIKDGVKVTVTDEHGGKTTETLRIIDWTMPSNNDFFL